VPTDELVPTSGDGYTLGMKTAVSLPDQVFQAAERHAKRAHKSRSQLYAEALAEYLTRHSPDEVTEAMNRVLEEVGGGQRIDPFVARAGRRILERTDW
jgi:hypothetical protein